LNLSGGFSETAKREFTPRPNTASSFDRPSSGAPAQSGRPGTSGSSNNNSNAPKQPSTDREYREAYQQLLEETAKLKSEISQKDVRIRQLESQLDMANNRN
jgi:coronin-1B/1C/6